MGKLRDDGFDARIVRDGKGSPGAWMYTGHDPQEPMSIVVPEEELTGAREALGLDSSGSEVSVYATDRRPVVLVGRFLVWLVIFVLVFALLRGPLAHILPSLGAVGF